MSAGNDRDDRWNWFLGASGLLLLFAAAIRLRGLNVSLFEDEVWVAELVRHGGMRPHTYSTPLLFYAIERGWAALRGVSVAALREPPALFGIALAAVAFLAPHERMTRFLWATLLAFSSPLLFYSMRLKQYTLEALVAAGLLILLLRALETRSRLLWTSFFALALLAASTLYGPIFIIAAAAVVAIPRAPRSAWGFLLVFAAFGAAYFFYLAPGPESVRLHGDMTAWFTQTGRWATSPSLFVAGTRHWVGQALNLVRFATIAAAALVLLWLIQVRSFTVLALALLPPLIIALASAFHLYPYGEVRLMLVCFPGLYLLFADALTAAAKRIPYALLLIVPFIASGLLLDTYNRTYMHIDDLTAFYDTIAANHTPGEPIYAELSYAAPLKFHHPELAPDVRDPAPGAGWHVGHAVDVRGAAFVIRSGDVTAARVAASPPSSPPP